MKMQKKTKVTVKNTLAFIAFAITLYLAFAIPEYVHSRKCDGCDWFWCAKFDGRGDI